MINIDHIIKCRDEIVKDYDVVESCEISKDDDGNFCLKPLLRIGNQLFDDDIIDKYTNEVFPKEYKGVKLILCFLK